MKSRRPTSPRVPKRNVARGRAATTSFLLEIGSEELPWQMIQPAMRDLSRLMDEFLAEHRLSREGVRAYGTPRRLAVVVTGLAARQAPASRETMGPSRAVAFDADNRPTKAATGFAQSQGVTVEQLEVRETPKGAYLCAVARDEGVPAATVFTAHLHGLLRRLTFPQTMRWNDSGVRYPRPIRWLVALLGATPVSVEFAGVRSGARSWGHRFQSGGASVSDKGMLVTRPETYESTLSRAGVMADPDKRRAALDERLTRLAREAGGTVYPGNRDILLEQAVFSLEWPNMLHGTFDSRYLTLPSEALISAMHAHQGFFSVVDRRRTLLAGFVAPINVTSEKTALIRTGNERVLAARLADARYFFDDDRKTALADRVSRLHGVVFHQRLGSLHDKTERVVALVAALAADETPDIQTACARAAWLCKADLVTGMVGEFPALQGVMGKHYAALDGESAAVCGAIGEHYQPRAPDDDVPVTTAGRLLSLADRLDTLSAFFHVGMIPSGSEDPYSLRRHAFGLIRLVIEAELNVNVGALLRRATHLLVEQGVTAAPSTAASTSSAVTSSTSATPPASTSPPSTSAPSPSPSPSSSPPDGRAPLYGFLEDRLRYYGRTVAGYREDVMASVLARRHGDAFDLRDLVLRMDALQAITRQPEFDPLMAGFTRVHRLVIKEAWTTDDARADRMTHEAERVLHESVDVAGRDVGALLASRDYHGALLRLMALRAPIDKFFDGVMVNAPEPDIRANRLSLLRRVDDVFSAFGDLSHMRTQSRPEAAPASPSPSPSPSSPPS